MHITVSPSVLQGEVTGLHLIMHVFTYVFVMLSILQSQFIEKAFKQTENSEQNVALLLFLLTLKESILVIYIYIFFKVHTI